MTTDAQHAAPGDYRRTSPSLRAIEAFFPSPLANLGQNSVGQHPDKRKAGGHSVGIADAVHALPTPTCQDAANLGGPSQAARNSPPPNVVVNQDWREYEPAIRRQEAAFGYPAPLPTEPNKNGKPRLSATFSEWLMGLEPGWITDTPGITRNEALGAAGNGIVPQQCYAAALAFINDLLNEGELNDQRT